MGEDEIIKIILAEQSFADVQKFIEEVCWRTYWRGWLRQHPTIWQGYKANLVELTDTYTDDLWGRAISGQTNIGCFDHWVHELKSTGYLHNHARMWFASIWIHTLKLPWELGAHFFMEHLLDADAASNTLSWRWVAGLHTKGKQYLARTSNISKYTGGRFSPAGLATEPVAVPDHDAKLERVELEDLTIVQGKHEHWLVLADDWTLERYLSDGSAKTIAMIHPELLYPDSSALRKAFVEGLFHDAKERHRFKCDQLMVIDSWQQFTDYCCDKREIAYLQPDVGPVEDAFLAMTANAPQIQWVPNIRPWDGALFPYCGRGFFQLKKVIPQLLSLKFS